MDFDIITIPKILSISMGDNSAKKKKKNDKIDLFHIISLGTL